MKTAAARKIHGIWPPLLLETRSDGRIDLDAIEASARHFADAGVHGVYTADTASEFYTMEFGEWDELAVRCRQILGGCGIAAGIGCTWTNQAGVLRRIARARELGYDNIHLSQPYWIKLNAAAQDAYWSTVAETAGDLPIIVYSGSQGQFPIDGPLLRRLCSFCPSIAGTKSAGFDAVATNSMLVHCPDLFHFVHEQVLTSWMAVGASGCFSALVGLCPALVLRWYDLITQNEWTAAFAIQRRVNRFYEEGVAPARRAGYVVDKAMNELGRVPGATRRLRPPYQALPDDLYGNLESAARRHLPEFAGALGARGA